MPGSQFPHLQLVAVERAAARLGRGGESDPRIKRNKDDRQHHAQRLSSALGQLSQRFRRIALDRAEAGLPSIDGGVPFMMEVAAEDGDLLDFLERKLGLEVVAEYADGFLMVAARDVEAPEFHAVLSDFEQEVRGSASAASVFEIHDAPDGEARLRRMLGADLFSLWPFPDGVELLLEVSFKAPTADQRPPRPERRAKESDEAYETRLANWRSLDQEAMMAVEDARVARESSVETMIAPYGGSIESSFLDSGRPHPQFAELTDSFSVRIRMSGKGFKDLILNHPHLFEVSLPDGVSLPTTDPTAPQVLEPPGLILQPPPADARAVCIIDSGIQEGHSLLAASIDTVMSRCFLPGTPPDEVADYVNLGGHGTRVAGAALFGPEIPTSGSFQSPFWIQNARVLGRDKKLPDETHPPLLLRTVVRHFQGGIHRTRIFNHSIAGSVPARRERMSAWAAEIDQLSHSSDVLIIQAVGNLERSSRHPNNPGLAEHLNAGRLYPEFLHEPSSRLANPAQSLQALAVGSIALEAFRLGPVASLADAGHPSPFTRSGPGLWDSIKPDVVEVGGDFAWNRTTPALLTTPEAVCPPLVRSTLAGGPAVARDTVGTSFATPRVSHLAGRLEALFPEQPALFYRALIAQSSRWPDWAENATDEQKSGLIKLLGFGIPDHERATANSDFRVTCVTNSVQEIRAGEAAIYSIQIPEELRRQASEVQLRLDITLSYSAEPRRTRSSRRGYLAVWCDWICSRPRERLDSFRGRALKPLPKPTEKNSDAWRWMLHERSTAGAIRNIRRGNGTLQKDWAYLRSYELPAILAVAVRGHAGWAHRNPESTAHFALAVTLEAVNEDLHVYEPIRQQILQRVEEARITVD